MLPAPAMRNRFRAWLKDNRGLLVFLVAFGVLRTAVADWNPIPSGSMRPTLLEGDVVLVDRLAYHLKLPLTDVVLLRLADPARGDVVTFSSPQDGTRLIKRIVGLPGDVVEVRGGRLHVNGEAAAYAGTETVAEPLAPGVLVPARRATETVGGASHRVQHLALPGLAREFGPQRVPEGHVFVLGDNRDNSADSRTIGPVPRALLIGRAHHLLVSADVDRSWAPRFARFGAAIE